MKLVHLISSLEMGGAQAVLYALISQLDMHEHTIIYFHDGPYRQQFEKLQVPLYHANFNLFFLIKLLKKLKPDCVHTSLWAANFLGRIAAWWCKIPCVNVLHNNKSLNGAMRSCLDCVAPRPTKCVAVSQQVKNSFGYSDALVITNGVHESGGEKKTRKDLGLDADHFIIGSVGRFHADKQYDLLLNAFAQIQNKKSVLVLMGAGQCEQQLRNLAHELGIAHRVLFIIGQPAHRYYHLFDCFVLTSPSEGISIALLEAMSTGVACLVRNNSQDHPVIRNGFDGIVMCTDNAAIIAYEIQKIMSDNKVRKKMGVEAQKTVQERYNVGRMVREYNELFKTMCTT